MDEYLPWLIVPMLIMTCLNAILCFFIYRSAAETAGKMWGVLTALTVFALFFFLSCQISAWIQMIAWFNMWGQSLPRPLD